MKIFRTLWLVGTLVLIILTSCNQQPSAQLQSQTIVEEKLSELKEGIITDIQTQVITEDSSNDRAITGALVGGAAGYLLSSRPSITKTLLSAGAGAVVGKTSGGKIKQYNNNTLFIRNIQDHSHTIQDSRNDNFRIGDTVIYNSYNDIVNKKHL